MGWVANASPEVLAQSQYKTVMAVNIILSVMSIAVVSCRLYIRATARGLAGDDWMAALSMVFAFAYAMTSIFHHWTHCWATETKYGLGLPLALRPKANLIPYTRVNYGGRPVYQTGISFFKIALCISYLRLLRGTDQKTYRKVVWFTIVLIGGAHLACALSLIFTCSPVDKSWNPLKEGTCLAPGPSFTAYAMVTIVSDVIVALLPIPILLKLNIRLGKKIGLIVIFMLGLFTTICSIMRYLQIDRIQNGDGNSTMLVIWGNVEFNVGNMVSSLPFLAPVCLRKAKDYHTRYYGRRYGSTQGISNRPENGEHYKLSDYNNDKNLVSANKSESEEKILQHNEIIKSMTYTVRIDEDKVGGKVSPRREDATSNV
ncbi:Uncharacterized protein TCAP_01990 [Tolypocladium capitatum]|uniref:Rhodopsin domain-containing protein n=1 Tax=Tolypocladium capitatum TaxID=45235 RepID=A0A2K3QKP5_9HYPO|nr:Uncharacterized protein TCAP_01990 [Tolypocladium capitatum]